MSHLLHKTYYNEMLKKERLLPIKSQGVISGFLSFYITNDDEKYIKADPYAVLDDDPNGEICYVAQVIVPKEVENPIRIWSNFKKHIKDNFGNVKYIHWNRGKNGTMYSYIKELKKLNA